MPASPPDPLGLAAEKSRERAPRSEQVVGPSPRAKQILWTVVVVVVVVLLSAWGVQYALSGGEPARSIVDPDAAAASAEGLQPRSTAQPGRVPGGGDGLPGPSASLTARVVIESDGSTLAGYQANTFKSDFGLRNGRWQTRVMVTRVEPHINLLGKVLSDATYARCTIILEGETLQTNIVRGVGKTVRCKA